MMVNVLRDRQLSLSDMLVVEDDLNILDFRCAITNIPLWPQIRVVFLRMMMSDLLYEVGLTGKSNAKIPASRAMVTMAKSLARNQLYSLSGRCQSQVCLVSAGVGNQLVNGRWFNRLSDYFVAAYPKNTLVIEEQFEWQWPSPREHDNVMLLAPFQAINVMQGRLRVDENHRRRARQLMSLVTERAKRFLQWEPGKARFERLVEMLARKAASMPSQYASYVALLERIRPRLLMVGAACYGPAAGMIAAAKSLGIVTAEYQHGAVSAGHDAYNFAPAIRDSKEYQRTLPEYFLGYGSWWNDQINAPIKKLAIGNPHRTTKLIGVESDASPKTDLLILSDGLDFDLYLELALKLHAFAQSHQLRVVLRPHPLERTWIASLPSDQLGGVAIDTNSDIYTSFSTAHSVISEVSTGLFEGVGIVENVFVWDTPKARFSFPNHPFQTFATVDKLVVLIEKKHSERSSEFKVQAIWANDWKNRYSTFLHTQGITCGY